MIVRDTWCDFVVMVFPIEHHHELTRRVTKLHEDVSASQTIRYMTACLRGRAYTPTGARVSSFNFSAW